MNHLRMKTLKWEIQVMKLKMLMKQILLVTKVWQEILTQQMLLRIIMDIVLIVSDGVQLTAMKKQSLKNYMNCK